MPRTYKRVGLVPPPPNENLKKDVCVFGPFKSYLKKSHNEWLRLNPGKRFTIKEVAKLSKQPFIESMTPKNIISVFECTGIFPFDRNKISEDRYAPSRVTDRPAPISIDVDSIDPTINPPVGQQINYSESESYPEEDLGQEDHCPLNIAEEHLPNTSSQPAILDVSQCNIPIAEEDTTLEQTVPTKTHVSPSALRPYPRVSQDQTSMLPKKKKRSGRSRVLTDTPEKDQIEVEHNKKVEKESQRLKRCLLKEIQVNSKRNATQSKPAAAEKTSSTEKGTSR